MTNIESIRNGTNFHFNELLKRISIDDLANMISENDCSVCICKSLCDSSIFSSCQEVVTSWLLKEVE